MRDGGESATGDEPLGTQTIKVEAEHNKRQKVGNGTVLFISFLTV